MKKQKEDDLKEVLMLTFDEIECLTILCEAFRRTDNQPDRTKVRLINYLLNRYVSPHCTVYRTDKSPFYPDKA